VWGEGASDLWGLLHEAGDGRGPSALDAHDEQLPGTEPDEDADDASVAEAEAAKRRR
jgi:hypothetical protein